MAGLGLAFQGWGRGARSSMHGAEPGDSRSDPPRGRSYSHSCHMMCKTEALSGAGLQTGSPSTTHLASGAKRLDNCLNTFRHDINIAPIRMVLFN